MTAIIDRIVKRDVLSVLLAQDFPRRSLNIITRLYRFAAKHAIRLVIDAKQIARDRIAALDYLARIILEVRPSICMSCDLQSSTEPHSLRRAQVSRNRRTADARGVARVGPGRPPAGVAVAPRARLSVQVFPPH